MGFWSNGSECKPWPKRKEQQNRLNFMCMLRKVLQERHRLGPTAHGSENVSHSNCWYRSSHLPLRHYLSLSLFLSGLSLGCSQFFSALSIVLAKFTLGQQAHKIVLNKKRRKQINNSISLPQRWARGVGRVDGRRVGNTHNECKALAHETENISQHTLQRLHWHTNTHTHIVHGPHQCVCVGVCPLRLPFQWPCELFTCTRRKRVTAKIFKVNY